MQLLATFEEDLIELHADYETKQEIFWAIAKLLDAMGYVRDMEDIYEKLINREELMTTGIGNGFAIPHAFTDALDSTIVIFISLAQPIDFAAVDNQPVQYIFALIGPKNKQVVHLKMLARVSRLISNREFLRELDKVVTKQNLFDLINRFDQEIAI